MTVINVVLQNLEHGGQGRWPLLRERIQAARPSVLLLSEGLGWADNDGHLLKRAEGDLGLKALRPLPPARSGHHVVIMYSPDDLGDPLDYNTDFAGQFEHAVCTTHLSPFAAADALAEAQKARWTALRYGDRKNDDHYYAVIGADFNAPPLFGPPAEVSRMNALDRASRFRDPECAIPNTDVAEAFARVGFADTSEVLYSQDGDERHLARTGQSDRIDRVLVTGRLSPAVTGGALLDAPAGAANHHGASRTLDLARARTA